MLANECLGERMADGSHNLGRAEVVVPAVGHARVQPLQFFRLELLLKCLLAGRLFLRFFWLGLRLVEPVIKLVV